MRARVSFVDVKDHPVANLALKVMLPIILLLVFYIQAHGEESPGGGFQAGAIAASAFALYVLAFGFKTVRWMAGLIRCLAAAGVGIYAVVGLMPMFMGGEYLNYSKLLDFIRTGKFVATVALGQKIGIFLVEIGVALTVFSAFALIIMTFLEEANVNRKVE